MAQQTFYRWFRRFERLLLFETIHDPALTIGRERAGQEVSPSGGLLNSLTVKAPAPRTERSFYGAKETVDPKCHVAIDTDGRTVSPNELREACCAKLDIVSNFVKIEFLS